ncbi:Leukotriene A-4 hydrolase [Podila epigama]|nr:Leukotriene A-4 hydrolase [Podila epigama]
MPYDPTSLSNLDEVKTNHIHLNLAVDFSAKTLSGSAELDVEAIADNVTKVILDTSYIAIHSVSINDNVLQYSVEKRHEKYGSALNIELPSALNKGDKTKILIKYATTEECTACQWLEPSQTVGKKHPYLFTQCQAIHARSLVPCQDSPSIKLTYSANITAPLRAVMSAVATGEEKHANGTTTFKFHQKTRMPSYLIALAVGNLEGRDIGPRSTVWTEPEVIEAAAWEFVDTETFIRTGEDLLTPYDWGRYDLLVLPASFPYGGMENPCLTFVTPSLLAGDRSLVDVVAHEISHSWCGNLVTTENWEHFWLNEGFTVFVERKILGRMQGKEAAEFSAIIGHKALTESVNLYGKDHPFTALRPCLRGEDPDDAFSSVPYEKGFNLLYYLEKHLGGAEVFEPYLKAHIQEFAGRSINTDDWKAFLYKFMEKTFGQDKVDLLNKVDWEAWLAGTGMPPVDNKFDDTLARACTCLCKKWDESRHEAKPTQFSSKDLEQFTSTQTVVFLERVSEIEPLPHSHLDLMDELYKLTSVRNSEIRFRWQMICLKANYEKIYPEVVAFSTSMGRMKFCRPLLRSLYHAKNGAELARKSFLANKSFYHPIASAMIAKDLGLANPVRRLERILYLEVAIHMILFVRGIYPPELFESTQKYGCPLKTARHPDLITYIHHIVQAVRSELQKDTVHRICVVSLDGSGKAVDRFVFEASMLRDLQFDPSDEQEHENASAQGLSRREDKDYYGGHYEVRQEGEEDDEEEERLIRNGYKLGSNTKRQRIDSSLAAPTARPMSTTTTTTTRRQSMSHGQQGVMLANRFVMLTTDLEILLRTMLLKISICDSFLLPLGKDCSFTVLIEMKSNNQGPPAKDDFQWAPVSALTAQDQGKVSAPANRATPQPKIIPVKTIELADIQLELFIEQLSR